MPKIKVDDLNLYYEIHGEGFPLVMIMGISCDTYWWDATIINSLAIKFKIIVFDHIGIGRSNGSARNQIKKMADDTVGLMNALNVDKAHIFGFSMGGMIAQELILNYPEKVEKLILCSTNCGGNKSVPASNEVLQLMMSFTRHDHDTKIAKQLIPLIFTEDFMRNNSKYINEKLEDMVKNITLAGNYANHLQAGMKHDTRSRLNQIKSPTLILHGKNDVLIPPENGEILANLIPGAELKYFDEPAHWIFVPDDKLISNAILDFLTN
ncbi:MAG: alpha/beta fold hydrolase [Promethearchaeota archaeon]